MTKDPREGKASRPQETESAADAESLRKLFHEIESQEGLHRSLELLKIVSPERAGRLATLVEEKGVPIVFNPERQNSSALKSLYVALHRDSEWAQRVEIKKGANLLELVHELAHAVPLRQHADFLREIPVVQPDLSLDDEALAEALTRISFLDEAVSVASEIEFEKDLQAAGIEIEDSFISKEARAVYASEGVQGVAARFGELFPDYNESYLDQSRRAVPALRGPVGGLHLVNWGDELGKFGVEADLSRGEMALTLTPKQVKTKLTELGARALATTRKDAAAGRQRTLDTLERLLVGRTEDNRLKERVPLPEGAAALPALELSAKPESVDPRTEALHRDPKASEYRVHIAGQAALVMHRAVERYGEKQAYGRMPGLALLLAEQAHGERSAHIYETLRQVLAEDDLRDESLEERHYGNAKKMAWSLMASGYATEGRQMQDYYIDNYASKRPSKEVDSFMLELIERQEEEAARRLFQRSKERWGKKPPDFQDHMEELKRAKRGRTPLGPEEAKELLLPPGKHEKPVAELNNLRYFANVSELLPPEAFSPEELGLFLDKWERRLQSALPHFTQDDYHELYWGGWSDSRKFREKHMAQSGLARPPSPEETQFYMKQRLAMAQMLSRLGGDREKERALQMIRGLPGTAHDVFYPYEEISPGQRAFVRKEVATSELSLFNPAQFKAHALLECAESDSEQAGAARREALLLLEDMEVDPAKESFAGLENKTWRYVEAFSSLVEGEDLEYAQRAYEGITAIVQKLRRYYDGQEELLKKPDRELERLPEFQKRPVSRARFETGSALKDIVFWEQHLSSALRAQLAVLAAREIGLEAAEASFAEVCANIDGDIQGRRGRFDERSIIQSAAEAAKLPQLESRSGELFGLAAKKIALQRGDYQIFKRGINYFTDVLFECGLGMDLKDEALKAFVLEMSPADLSDWGQMREMIPELLRLSKVVGRTGTYPNAEREILRILSQAAESAEFISAPVAIFSQATVLEEVSRELHETHPEIFHPANFEDIAGFSEEPDYLQKISALFPELAWEHMAGGVVEGDGLFDMVKIKAGMHSLEATMQEAYSELDRVLASPALVEERLEHIAQVCEELGRQDLVAALADNSKKRLSYSEIAALRSSGRLLEVLDDKLWQSEADLSSQEVRLVEALLHADGQEEAEAKYEFYLEFIGSDRSPTEVQRIAFENLVISGRIGRTVTGYFEDNVINGSDDLQRRFFKTAGELLRIGGNTLSGRYDSVNSWVLENLERSEDILPKVRTAYSQPTINSNTEIGGEFYSLSTYDEAGFNLEWTRYRENSPESWVPDLLAKDDLFLAYTHRFEGFMDPAAFEAAVRYIYIDEEFQYSTKRQEISLRGDHGWDYITEGDMGVALRVFGPRKLSIPQKETLSAALLDLRKGIHRRRSEADEREASMPEVLERQPQMVRFILREYFKQLPYGERQALVSEFESEGGHLTGPEAIRRTFELTGTEKIGQFLSVRRDLLPPEYCKELEKFQEHVEGTAFEEIRGTIETELGQPLNKVFQDVDPVPLNIGTIGQVHEGRLLNGDRVVIKVIPPNKRRIVRQMLDRMQTVCSQLDKNKERFPGAYDPMGMYREFKTSIEEELDFRREYANAESLRETMGEGISTPRYYENLATRGVLVQGFAEGIRLADIPGLDQRKSAVADIGEMLMSQILEKGEFHDDLHPGNIRFSTATGEKVILDYGRVGRLSQEEKEGLIPLLIAIRDKSAEEVLRVLEPLGEKSSRFDRAGLRATLADIMADKAGDTSVMINKLFAATAEHGLAAPPSYLRVLKAVTTFEGSAREADPGFDLQSFLKMTVLKKKLKGVGGLLAGFMK